MVLPGQPSTPEARFSGFTFGQLATQAMDSGKTKPFIAVFPPLMIAPRDAAPAPERVLRRGQLRRLRRAETDPTTGSLFKGSSKLRNENSLIWLIKQPPHRQTDLLIVASKQDKDSWAPGAAYADTAKMVTQSSGIPGVATLSMATGGHNYTTYGPTLPQSFAWLAQAGAV